MLRLQASLSVSVRCQSEGLGFRFGLEVQVWYRGYDGFTIGVRVGVGLDGVQLISWVWVRHQVLDLGQGSGQGFSQVLGSDCNYN